MKFRVPKQPGSLEQALKDMATSHWNISLSSRARADGHAEWEIKLIDKRSSSQHAQFTSIAGTPEKAAAEAWEVFHVWRSMDIVEHEQRLRGGA